MRSTVRNGLKASLLVSTLLSASCLSRRTLSEPIAPIVIDHARAPSYEKEDGIDLRPLALELGSPDIQKRKQALKSLEGIGTQEALKIILGALGDGSPEIRKETIMVIHRMGGPSVWDRIVPMLFDEDAGVRMAAVEAFRDPGFFIAINSLEDAARNDLDGSVRERAREILSTVYGKEMTVMHPE